MAKQSNANQWGKLYDNLLERLDGEELRSLCFYLGIEYDDLRGAARKDKARELIRYCRRNDRVGELLAIVGGKWPAGDWPNISELTQTAAPQEYEIRTERDRQGEDAWQKYLDQMQSLLLENGLHTSKKGDMIKAIARTRTLTVLDKLDKKSKGMLLRFLHEAGLIFSDAIVDLSDADFSKANLSWADLSKANLSGACLCEADLTFANLCEADLSETDLLRANLSWADLSRCYLRNAFLREADVRESNLRRADLREATLFRAVLFAADLDEADFSEADLREAILGGTYPCGTYFSYADLRGAILRGVCLSYADLRGADLRGADLRGVDLREADLSEASLSRAEYDLETKWPEGFDPVKAGAVLDPTPSTLSATLSHPATKQPAAIDGEQ